MLPSITQLLILLLINTFVQFNAQLLPPNQKFKTFANTKFDLNTMPSFHDDAAVLTTKTPEISRQKSHLSVKIRPAATNPTTTATEEQVELVKPKLRKKSPQQPILISINPAPRAKSNRNEEAEIRNLEFNKESGKKFPPEIISNNAGSKIIQKNSSKLFPKKNANLFENQSQKFNHQPSLLSSSSSTSLSLSLSKIHGTPTATVSRSAVASGNTIKSGSLKANQFRQFSSNSQPWFRDIYPSPDCSQDFQQMSREFQRKFPAQTLRDVQEKRLAELIKKRLIDCDQKSKNNHWQVMIDFLVKAKLSPSEEESCTNGLIQERIACINLLSYTCQFISHDYTFRLLPARVIVHEARLVEDGVAKCTKVKRLVKKKPSN